MYDVIELVRLEPTLLRPLTVLVERVCHENLAAHKVRQMNGAAQDHARLPRTKNGNPRQRDLKRDQNAARRQAREQNLLHGLNPLDHVLGELHLQGVSSDGREWLINAQRLPFARVVLTYPEALPELLVAARARLYNFPGLVRATAGEVPGLLRHTVLWHACRSGSPYQPGETVTDHGWVRDALAQERRQTGVKPSTRPLHNRARFVR